MWRGFSDRLLEWLQRDCDHTARVTADILEGDVKGEGVQWCQRCGAYRRHDGGTVWPCGEVATRSQWIEPRATWARGLGPGCWWKDCRRQAWVRDWSGMTFCLRHALKNLRLSGGSLWFKVRHSRFIG